MNNIVNKLKDFEVEAILLSLRDDSSKQNVKALAEQYHVIPKTITRIAQGKTWREAKESFDAKNTPPPPARVVIQTYSSDVLDLIDVVPKVKAKFGLKLDVPLDFGAFTWYDGVHYVVSDGVILWESESLYTLAKHIGASKEKGDPLFASRVCEMPMITCRELLTQPYGSRLLHQECFSTGVSKWETAEKTVVWLSKKHTHMILRMGLDVFIPETPANYVLLTKTKTNRGIEHIEVHACLATITEQ